MTDKKNIPLWALYDFGNSIVVIVFFLYFSQWLVVDHGVSDFWYNMIPVGSSILLLITTPILGARADRLGRSLPYLRVVTILEILAFLIAGIIAVFLPQSKTMVFIAALVYMLANFFYQFSLMLYSALLPQLAEGKKVNFLSGLGQAANWVGQMTGILITLPFALGTWYLVGHAGREQTFIPATLIAAVFMIPLLLFFKEKTRAKQALISIGEEYKTAFRHFKELCQLPSMGFFLLGYFFFNDAMLTAANNLPIYFAQVFDVSDQMKSLVALGILVTAAIGAFMGGLITMKIGLKKALLFILVCWTIALPLLALIDNFIIFGIVTACGGLLFGSTFAVCRSAMIALTPTNRLNHAFSYYTLMERFSTFVGPLVWGGITTALIPLGDTRYRIALAAMGLFMLTGYLIMRRVTIPEQENG